MKEAAGYVERADAGDEELNEKQREAEVNAARGACTLTFNQMPKWFAWDTEDKYWRLRESVKYEGNEWVRTMKAPYSIGRLYNVSPKNVELFALRRLLVNLPGVKGFDDLQAIHPITGKLSFRAQAEALKLFVDSREFEAILDEVKDHPPGRVRFVLFQIIAFADCRCVKELWVKFKEYLCDRENGVVTAHTEAKGLMDLERMLKTEGGSGTLSLSQFFDAEYLKNLEAVLVDHDDLVRTEYNQEQQYEKFKSMYAQLSEGQKHAVGRVKESMDEGLGKRFFLCGVAGTGKTFVYETLLAYARSHRGVVRVEGEGIRTRSAVAVSGWAVAGTLMTGGTTAHSRFRLPLDNVEKVNDTFKNVHADPYSFALIKQLTCLFGTKHLQRTAT
ncbi:hypothetical protein DIPPA_09729 [Diplonema papillatum]|nr:hypothetical protein DIPPA_09729 [Diplonema papillatum]